VLLYAGGDTARQLLLVLQVHLILPLTQHLLLLRAGRGEEQQEDRQAAVQQPRDKRQQTRICGYRGTCTQAKGFPKQQKLLVIAGNC
jgi:hypothetical protein